MVNDDGFASITDRPTETGDIGESSKAPRWELIHGYRYQGCVRIFEPLPHLGKAWNVDEVISREVNSQTRLALNVVTSGTPLRSRPSAATIGVLVVQITLGPQASCGTCVPILPR